MDIKKQKIFNKLVFGVIGFFLGLVFCFVALFVFVAVFGVHPPSESYHYAYLFLGPVFPWAVGVVSNWGFSLLSFSFFFRHPFFSFLLLLPYFFYGIAIGCFEKKFWVRLLGLILLGNLVLFSYLEILLSFWKGLKV